MKNLKTILALSGLGLALGLTAQLSTPADSSAFSLLGHNLKNGQRDFRIFNNFTDTSANNNTTPSPNFPGALGADQAIWKGHVEWGSGLYAGTGDGDPLQNLGNGGANFDNHFQGAATSTGGTSSNIHSQISGSGGGVLAFMQGGGNGWWIRYYQNINWSDGPGGTGGGSFDLQAVATHEIGHALGLGHSATGSATMAPSIAPGSESERSVNSDDQAGIQAIYGVKVAGKPLITGLSGNFGNGTVLTISGSNFANSGNEVWFTDTNSSGVATKVTGVSSSGGGTTINVTIPNDAIDGTVMVNNGDGTHIGLSNGWPMDIDGSGPVLDPPMISSFTPNLGQSSGWTEVTISGDGFNGTTSVEFGLVDALSFTVDSDTQITAVSPPAAPFTSVNLTVTDLDGEDTSAGTFIYTFDNIPQISSVTPNSGDVAGGDTVVISGPNTVGVTSVTFGGVPGTNVTVTSGTTLEVDTPAGSNGAVDVAASNFGGTDVLVDGFTYTGGGPGGAFVDLGPSGTGGTLGEPTLTGTGDLTPGGAGYSLTIDNSLPFATGTLFITIGDGSSTAAFKGGVFYTLPILVQVSFGLSIGGNATLPLTVDGSIVGPVSLVWQWWNLDAGAIVGVAGSNGLRTDIP